MIQGAARLDEVAAVHVEEMITNNDPFLMKHIRNPPGS
jgi:hypothetical protein